jgi:pyridoxine 4-dehydrogenase
MSTPDAALSGTFAIGGDLIVNRLGFGAMRITGPGIWGEPEDPEEARRTLRRVPELGINFIDTAESYGPYVSEQLIGEELAPYAQGSIIATKSGLTRHGPGSWPILGRPEFLKQGVLMSLRRLKLERLDLWQLHRIDPTVPRDEQFDAIAGFIADGLVRHAGLSEVTVEEIEAARRFFPSPPYRTATTRRRAAAMRCSTIARPTVSASFPGRRSAASEDRAPPSRRSLPDMGRRPARSPSPGR